MDTKRLGFAVATVIPAVLPVAAFGCEPILPLAQLMSGATAVGPALILQSATWLVVAVCFKTAIFVAVERRLTRKQAATFMLLANAVSTVPGVLTAAFAGAFNLLSLPIIFGFGKLAEKRLSLLAPAAGPRWYNGVVFAPVFTAAFLLSVVLFYMAGSALGGGNYRAYWLLKFAFTTTAAALGMAISTILEEYAVARLSRKQHGQLSFYPSVLRANYITLAAVLAVAACQTLPQRLNAPHFLSSWARAVAATLGLT